MLVGQDGARSRDRGFCASFPLTVPVLLYGLREHVQEQSRWQQCRGGMDIALYETFVQFFFLLFYGKHLVFSSFLFLLW